VLNRIAQRLGQRGLALRHDEVNVIGHQAVCPHAEAVFIAVLFKKAEVGTAVAARLKHILAPIAALGNMVGKTGCYNACDSAHVLEDISATGKRK